MAENMESPKIKKSAILEQSELFSAKDYVLEQLKIESFSGDREFFQKREIPPNNPEKYYFGVDFTNTEHRVLILLLVNPESVLKFYSRVSGFNGEISDVANPMQYFICPNERYITTKEDKIAVSVITKVAEELKHDTRLKKIVDTYAEIVRERATLRSETADINQGSYLNKAETVEKRIVYKKLGGWENVRKAVQEAISEMLKANHYMTAYTFRTIEEGNFKQEFSRIFLKGKGLSSKEGRMAKKIISWHFGRVEAEMLRG